MVRHKRRFWDSQRPKSQNWSDFINTQKTRERQAQTQLKCLENGNREIIDDDESLGFTRIQQKMNSERAALLQKEFDKKSTALGELQFKESCTLMKTEGAERAALLDTMRHENPETKKIVREFTDGIMQKTLEKLNKNNTEKNALHTQEMANRHATADQETYERLSFWQQLQQKPESKKPAGKISSATQKRLDRLKEQPTEVKHPATTTQPSRAKSPEEFVRVESPAMKGRFFPQSQSETKPQDKPQDINTQKPAETSLFWKMLGY